MAMMMMIHIYLYAGLCDVMLLFLSQSFVIFSYKCYMYVIYVKFSYDVMIYIIILWHYMVYDVFKV